MTSRFVLLGLLLAACTSVDDPGHEGGSGGETSNAGAGGIGGEGDGAGGSMGTAGGAGTGGAEHAVHIQVHTPSPLQQPFGNNSGLLASFSTLGGGSGGEPPCVRTEVGPCHVEECTVRRGGGGGPGGQPTVFDAGVITVEGGLTPISLDAGACPTWCDVTGPSVLFEGGERLTFTVEGSAEVPAFTTTLVAPEPVVITDPDLEGFQLVIDRSQDFDMTWSGGEGGVVFFYIVTSEEPSRTANAFCEFDGAAGSGTLPAELLSLLPASGPGVTQSYGTAVVAQREVTGLEAWLASVSAASLPTTPNGYPATAVDLVLE